MGGEASGERRTLAPLEVRRQHIIIIIIIISVQILKVQ